jgi:hypothetical protein
MDKIVKVASKLDNDIANVKTELTQLKGKEKKNITSAKGIPPPLNMIFKNNIRISGGKRRTKRNKGGKRRTKRKTKKHQ